MRAGMSLVRAWAYGIVMFLAMTASLALAFSIAITGPPTDEEIEGAEALLGAASREFDAVARRLGEQACADLPPDMAAGFCAGSAAPEPAPAAREDLTPPAAPPRQPPADRETAVSGLPNEADANLLGGVGASAVIRPPERAPRRRAHGAATQRFPSARRVTPRSIERATVRELPSIPATRDEPLADIRQAPIPDVARERLTQYEAAPAEEYVEDDWYERDEYADEYYVEEYYDDDAYEAERRYREQRRRARERRRYGGW